MTNIRARQPYARRPAPQNDLKPFLDTEFANIQRGIPVPLVRAVFADDTVQASDDTIEVDATAGPLTVSLGPADRLQFLKVTVKRVNDAGGIVTVSGDMDGISSFELRAGGQSLTVQSDGAVWQLVQQDLDPGSYVIPQDGRTDTTLTEYLANNAVYNVRDYGAVGDGVANDTAANSLALSKAIASGGGGVVYPAGTYLLDPFVIPENVVLMGHGFGATTLKTRDLTGTVFLFIQGSNSGLFDLTINGRRAEQPTDASATVVAARPNGTVGDGSPQAGGVLLHTSVSPADTSIVLTALPTFNILPGDSISLVEGSVVEYVVVAFTYVPGSSTTIPLHTPTRNAFTTAANVTVCLKNIVVRSSRIFAVGFTALTYWHVTEGLIVDNFIYDAYDTCLDFSSGGNTQVIVAGNTVETNGRFGMAVDEQLTSVFGPTEQVQIVGNTVRMLTGGPVGKTASDAIWLGSIELCVCTGNAVDIRSAGLSGIRALQTATQLSIVGNSVHGRSNPDTSVGIRVDALPSDIAINADRRITISDNVVRSCDSGIDVQASTTAVICGNVVRDCGTAIQGTLHATLAQDIVVRENIVDGGSVGVIGINFNVTGAGAASLLRLGSNIIRNQSFKATNVDLGWTVIDEDTFKPVLAGVSADRGDTSAVLTGLDAPSQIWASPLTAPRTSTLPTSGVYDGMHFKHTRATAATGASTLTVGGGGFVKVLAVGQWCLHEYSTVAGAWTLVAAGAL